MKKIQTSKIEVVLRLLTGKFVTVTNDVFWISGILKGNNHDEYFVQTSDAYADVEFNIANIEAVCESAEENPPITEKYLIKLL